METETIPQKLWQWLKGLIVGPVPEADAVCEFDCRKGECNEGEWTSCERRVQKAAGELWPAPSTSLRAKHEPPPGHQEEPRAAASNR